MISFQIRPLAAMWRTAWRTANNAGREAGEVASEVASVSSKQEMKGASIEVVSVELERSRLI